MQMINLNDLVIRVEDIPILSNIIRKIINIIENTSSSINDLEEEILKDQSMTSKILKLANSTYYGYSKKIHTISEAIILLGSQTIKSLVLTSAVSSFLISELPESYYLQKNELWNQSQSCALISKVIAVRTNYPNPEQAYIAGLLRDIGKPILNYYVSQQYENILNKVANDNKTFIEAEEDILGFNHAQIGAMVAEKWCFPTSLVECIKYHHEPEKSQSDAKLVSIVHVADAIVMMMGLGLGSDGLAYNFSDFSLKTLNINEKDLEKIVFEVGDLFKNRNEFMI